MLRKLVFFSFLVLAVIAPVWIPVSAVRILAGLAVPIKSKEKE